MPSSPSTRLRLELQATGENLNSWGTRLNTAINLVEESVAGVLTLSLTGNVTLTATNYASDQSRNRVLAFTDGGLGSNPTVTIPAVQKLYEVHNRTATRDIIITAGGVSVTVRAGQMSAVYCNGTDCFIGGDPRLNEIRAPNASVNMNSQKITGLGLATLSTDAASLANRLDQFAAPTAPVSMGSQVVTNVATPSAGTDAANRAFVQSEIAVASTINLPSVTGQSGRYLTNNGTVASWADVTSVLYREYDTRADLRSIDGPADAMCVVRGLGLFSWLAGSIEPDDDETCFATSGGRWLLNAASWDVAYLYWLAEIDAIRVDAETQSLQITQRFNNSFLFGTAVCSLSTVNTVTAAAFTATVAGASPADRVLVNPPAALETSTTGRLGFYARVSAANTITVTLVNPSAASSTINTAVTGASNPWSVLVIKQIGA